MNEITVRNSSEIPKGYTGYVKYTNGTQMWYKNGKRHREDGPALIWYDGTQMWWLNSRLYSKEAYYQELHKRGIITEQELFIELL